MSPVVRHRICLLGLPFDTVTIDEAVQQVREAIEERRRLFLSTPNLNFVAMAQDDEAFRASVLDSDLVVADGMPLVWLSRLLGAHLPERVSGSNLFERLRDEPLPEGKEPIRVYFFGGPEGSAEAAAQNLNQNTSSLKCVGWQSPGFGTVGDLSARHHIDPINGSGADFLVVALGAAKGQAWIQHNRDRLFAPVISHMGAVVNFIAGQIKRAPTWMQRSGLEWAWRIKEEPRLWKRYTQDARILSKLILSQVLPYAIWRRAQSKHCQTCTHRWTCSQTSEQSLQMHLALEGHLADSVPTSLKQTLHDCLQGHGEVRIDIGQLMNIGPAFAATLAYFLHNLRRRNRSVVLSGLNRRTERLLRWNGLTPSRLSASPCAPERCSGCSILERPQPFSCTPALQSEGCPTCAGQAQQLEPRSDPRFRGARTMPCSSSNPQGMCSINPVPVRSKRKSKH